MKKKKQENKSKFKNLYSKKKINFTWILFVTCTTFLIAILLESSAKLTLGSQSFFISILLLILIITIGILFDLLGIAVTAAIERPFHAMASKKVKGAKESINILRNAGAVANFFNDVVGDISGIVSGSVAVTILIKMNHDFDFNKAILSVLLTGIIASLTVGGKAFGKEIALRNANAIVFKMGVFLSLFKKKSS